MDSRVFMDKFERTAFSDDYYGVLGRALVIATRFEKNLKTLAMIRGMKEKKEYFETEKEIERLVLEIEKRPLFKNIEAIRLLDVDLLKTLEEGRKSRNFIAHEAGIGLDMVLDNLKLSFLENYENEIKEKVGKIAIADRLVCILLLFFTNDLLPTKTFLFSYPENIVQWVITKKG